MKKKNATKKSQKFRVKLFHWKNSINFQTYYIYYYEIVNKQYGTGETG